MKKLTLLIALLFPVIVFSQYLLKNEEVIYAFETKTKKKLVLVKDTSNAYIQYRFGTANKIELQYPANKTKESWDLFQYNFYIRGGGKQNAGQEIANLVFIKDGFQYMVYQTYFSENEKYNTGILIENLKTKKQSRVNGIYRTIQQSLFYLDDETPLKVEDIGLEF